MKIKQISIIVTIVCILFVGTAEATAQSKEKLVGNKNAITKTISTQEYDIIKVKGSIKVILQKGTEGTIKVETEKNSIDLVEVTVEGNTLNISLKNKAYYQRNIGVKVYVPFTDLTEVSLNGSGDIISSDTINASTFTTSLHGSGDINLVVSATTVDARINGSGDLNLKGKSTNLNVEMTGSGDFDSIKMNTQHTDAKLTGSGDILVNAATSIKARLTGSGGIEYNGNPETSDNKVKGSGDIDTRN
jgi:hypothetical protein